MEELIKWLQEVGPAAGAYSDDLYVRGKELYGHYGRNAALKVKFQVLRPSPFHKKLLRNTLKRTADLLEGAEALVVKKKAAAAPKAPKDPAKGKSANPKKGAASKGKKTDIQKPTSDKPKGKGIPK